MSNVGAATIRHWVAELDETEAQIKALQDAKRDLYSAIRDEHGKTTADGLKQAMKLHRMDGAKRENAEAIDAEAFRILNIIESGTAIATHVARRALADEPPAAPSKEISPNGTADKGYSHAASQEEINAETGEITEQPDSTVEVSAPHSNVHSLRPAKKLRPNCLNPERCAGMGPTECWSCLKAMSGQSEAAQ